MSKEELQDYGFNSISQVVAEACGISYAVAPSSKLAELCGMAMSGDSDDMIIGTQDVRDDGVDDDDRDGEGLNLEKSSATKTAPNYNAWFTTIHKDSVRTAIFSADGRFIATGSADTSLKVLDVSKIRDSHRGGASGEPAEKPVIRTLYDHQLPTFKCYTPTVSSEDVRGPIKMVRFAPKANFFAAAGLDGSIRLHDTKNLISATFGCNDDFVLTTDEYSNMIICWDARTGALLRKYTSGHQKVVRGIAASPTDGAFVTFSDDCRARYWGID
ncbi:cleavage stimulation factor, 3' pre-RNA, subunit 1 [Dinochytrium kinnereticum]|nr:cleavage stimulation factor, 3' pre-RNA, subunit 1 [Dinochytrium kinnereticum]